MITEVQSSDLFPADLPVNVRERDGEVDGNLTGHELDVMSKLVKLHDPEVIFEFGTFNGRTALNLAANSRPTARVYTLDLPQSGLNKAVLNLEYHDKKYIDKPVSGNYFHGTDVEHKITQLWGDSATFDYSPYVGKVDFVFVDGSHSYEYVRSDSLKAIKLIKPEGGVIVWHDYATSGIVHWPNLVRALQELQAGHRAFAGMRHIVDTKFAILEVSAKQRRSWLKAFVSTFLRGQQKAVRT